LVHSILRKYRIKGGVLDQHFLIDAGYLDRIVAAADLSSEDTVLEIGAGIGNLTERLARKAKKVLAIELDPALVAVLHDRFDAVENIEIIPGDALKLDFPDFDKAVSNLPYSMQSVTDLLYSRMGSTRKISRKAIQKFIITLFEGGALVYVHRAEKGTLGALKDRPLELADSIKDPFMIEKAYIKRIREILNSEFPDLDENIINQTVN